MAGRHEETVDKKIGRMLAQFILTEHRDDNLTMPDIVDGCSIKLIEIISLYPQWTAAKIIPPLARPIMKDRVKGIHVHDGEVPMLPGFEGIRLGFRFAVPPRKVVEEEVEAIDEMSNRTIWIPRHKILQGEFRRHVQSYRALRDDVQKELDLRQEVLTQAEHLGGTDEEVLIDILGRA